MKRGVILLVILAPVMVVLWLWVLGVVPGKKTVKQLIQKSAIIEVSPEELRNKAEKTALSLSNWLEKQEKMDKVLVYHEGRRDPLLPPVKKKGKEKEVKKSLPIQPPKLELKGIAWDETEPLALVNDLFVKEGDTIQGAMIVKIEFDRIAVRYRSKGFVIKLIEWDEK